MDTQRSFRLAGLCILLAVVAPMVGCETDAPTEVGDSDVEAVSGAAEFVSLPGGLKVMTWNVYVGTDVDRVLAAQTPDEIPILVAEAFQLLLSTDFSERAEAFVDQIQRARPHVIGLQEISTILVQSPGDAVLNGTVPAEDVLFDYLQILMEALEARGLDYRVAGLIENADVEVPMLVDPATPAFDDIRLIDFDVVLVRGDVGVSDVEAANYQAKLPVPGFGIEIPRGYVAVDVGVWGRDYRFVNTHLEPAALSVRLAQAEELTASLVSETMPVIIVGDLNTPAPTGDVYKFFQSQGYVDVWTRNLRRDEGLGYTNAHDLDLRNEESQLYQRIDLIFVRNPVGPFGHTVVGPVLARVVGDELGDRTDSGLWPSDHAGVTAAMLLPFRRSSSW